MIKRKFSDFRFLLYTYILLLLVMFILPFFSVDTYSMISNTTSHLGAQKATNAWIMNVTFCLVGISCVLEAWIHLGKNWFHKVILSIFGLSLVFVGIFQHAPIIEGVNFNETEDKLHSIFATIIGFVFILYAISSAFIEEVTRHRIIDLSIGFFATFLTILMINIPDYLGIWQRVMFIISFTWLILMIERFRKLKLE